MLHVDPVDAVSALVRTAVVNALGTDFDADSHVRRSDRADLQADLAMRLARQARRAPRAIAEAIVAALPANDVIERIEVANPGFLNIWLRNEWLATAASAANASDRLAVPRSETPERIVIDYSHPNVAKEMHVGHLRSTVIGDSLARVLEWRGHTILRQNHIGDWGTLFGMLIEHMVDLGEAQAVAALGIGQLAQFYKAAREVRQRAGVRASLAPPRRRAASGRPADAAAVARARRSVDALLRDHLRNTRHHAAAR